MDPYDQLCNALRGGSVRHGMGVWNVAGYPKHIKARRQLQMLLNGGTVPVPRRTKSLFLAAFGGSSKEGRKSHWGLGAFGSSVGHGTSKETDAKPATAASLTSSAPARFASPLQQPASAAAPRRIGKGGTVTLRRVRGGATATRRRRGGEGWVGASSATPNCRSS